MNEQDQVEVQDQVKSEDQAIQQDQQSTQQTDLEKRLSEVEERYKAELKGLNKKVSVLEKEKEALELSKLSETERVEAEKKKAVEEAESIKAETEKLRRERDLTKILYDEDLDPSLFGNRIVGNTAEEMLEDAKALKDAIDKAVEAKLEKEVNRRLGGKEPEGGKSDSKLSYAEQVRRAAKLTDGKRY